MKDAKDCVGNPIRNGDVFVTGSSVYGTETTTKWGLSAGVVGPWHGLNCFETRMISLITYEKLTSQDTEVIYTKDVLIVKGEQAENIKRKIIRETLK